MRRIRPYEAFLGSVSVAVAVAVAFAVAVAVRPYKFLYKAL